MERITYTLSTGLLTGPKEILCDGDNLTVELAIDSTGTKYEDWEKRCDLQIPGGTDDILGFSAPNTDIIAVFTLTSAHLKNGALVVNPYVQKDGARKGFPKRSITVVSQLNKDTATSSVRVIIENYINTRLTVKAVTATPLAHEEPATATVTIESDGTSFDFGLPKGDQGIQGLQGEQGIQGLQCIQGLKGNQWRGAYSGATAYVVDDVVSYLGSSYICILASINNLPTNATYWQLFATTGTAIASNVTNTPAGGISATNVQTALNELDTEKANKVQKAWITPTLLNGWTSVAGYTVQYMKDDFGFVHFRGRLASGTVGAQVFLLPTGYIPNQTAYFILPHQVGNGIAPSRGYMSTNSAFVVDRTYVEFVDLTPVFYKV